EGMICFRGVLNAPPSRTGTLARYSSGPRTDDRHPRAPALTTAPAAAIAATQPGRVAGLDGIRGLAALGGPDELRPVRSHQSVLARPGLGSSGRLLRRRDRHLAPAARRPFP